jgi:hypothetical protein
MREHAAKDIDVRPSSTALWWGILSGPISFAIDLQLRYALVPYACAHGFRWMLVAIAVPLLLVCIVSAFLSWRGWVEGNDDDSTPSRIRFMAISGVVLSAAFALTIIANAIPSFFISPCD